MSGNGLNYELYAIYDEDSETILICVPKMQSITAFTKTETDKCAILRISGKKERVSRKSAYSDNSETGIFIKYIYLLSEIKPKSQVLRQRLRTEMLTGSDWIINSGLKRNT